MKKNDDEIVPCTWVACGCSVFDSCSKCGGAGGKYTPVNAEDSPNPGCHDKTAWEDLATSTSRTNVDDVVRVTTAPWADQRGIIESIDGAYHIVRLDTSQHPEDVQELYPNEFVVVCQGCEHDKHEPGKCEFLHIYARGPNDPPGNQGCLCGLNLDAVITSSNEDSGWTFIPLDEEEDDG